MLNLRRICPANPSWDGWPMFFPVSGSAHLLALSMVLSKSYACSLPFSLMWKFWSATLTSRSPGRFPISSPSLVSYMAIYGNGMPFRSAALLGLKWQTQYLVANRSEKKKHNTFLGDLKCCESRFWKSNLGLGLGIFLLAASLNWRATGPELWQRQRPLQSWTGNQ